MDKQIALRKEFMGDRKRYQLLSLCLIILFTIPAWQGAYARQSTKDPIPKAITRFSFIQLYGGVIIIKAAIDNIPDSLNFILDTGSGGISLDSTSAESIGIKTMASNRTIRGIAGIRTVRFAYNHQLKLPGLTVDSLDFHINDYEMLSGVYGVQIDGIIGYSFFRQYIVGIDFDQQLISVFPMGTFTYPKTGFTLRPAIAALPMQYAEVTDNTSLASRYYIDTGAGLCLLVSTRFAGDSSLFKPGKKMYTSVAEGIGGKKDMNLTVVKKFKLGKYKFKKMPVYVFEDEFNVTNYPFLSGLIGNDLLRRFNLTINYSRSEFHLIPNKSYKEPFDYAYTGFNMFQDGGDVIIIDVMPDSPAEKAGLKDTDIILSIGNKFGGNLQDYKNILQQPGNRINMVISRGGKLEEIKIHITSIKKIRQKKAKR
jgi:hypothetical protein